MGSYISPSSGISFYFKRVITQIANKIEVINSKDIVIVTRSLFKFNSISTLESLDREKWRNVENWRRPFSCNGANRLKMMMELEELETVENLRLRQHLHKFLKLKEEPLIEIYPSLP